MNVTLIQLKNVIVNTAGEDCNFDNKEELRFYNWWIVALKLQNV